MFRFTLVVVVVSLLMLVAIDHPAKVLAQTEDEYYYFTHPTFDHAAALPVDRLGTLEGVMKTDRVAVHELLGSGHLIGYRNKDFEEFDPTASAETITTSHNIWGIYNPTLSRTSYVDERNRAKQTLMIDKANFANGHCHRFTFRAFDLVRMPVGTQPKYIYGVGIDQGHSVCLIKYDSFSVKTKDLFNSEVMRSIQVIANTPKTYYKISSIWTRGDTDKYSSTFFVYILDEAGYLYQTEIDTASGNFTRFMLVDNYSSIKLDSETSSLFRFYNPSIEKEIRQADPNGMGLEVMKRHYKHSFIEAITIHDGSLVYSRGMFVPNERRLNAIGPAASLPIFSKLFEVDIEPDVAIVALEMYIYNGTRIVQMATSRERRNPRAGKVYDMFYHYCQVTDLNILNKHDLDQPFEEGTTFCEVDLFRHRLLPIDIVFMDKCGKTVLFHQHAYQMFGPTQRMNDPDQPLFNVVDWMTSPANAFLFHHDRLYMFNSGNELFISEPITGCSLDSFQWESRKTTQSQLLLRFAETIHHGRGKRQVEWEFEPYGGSNQVPNFYSRRHKSNGVWDPLLDKTDDLKPEHELSPKQSPIPTLPPPYSTTPGPTESSWTTIPTAPTSNTTYTPTPPQTTWSGGPTTRPTQPTPPFNGSSTEATITTPSTGTTESIGTTGGTSDPNQSTTTTMRPTPEPEPESSNTILIVVIAFIIIIVIIIIVSAYYFCFADSSEPQRPKSSLSRQRTAPTSQQAPLSSAGRKSLEQSQTLPISSVSTARSSFGPSQIGPGVRSGKSLKSLTKTPPPPSSSANKSVTKSIKSASRSPTVNKSLTRSPGFSGKKSVGSAGASRPARLTKSGSGTKSPKRSGSKSPKSPSKALKSNKSIKSASSPIGSFAKLNKLKTLSNSKNKTSPTADQTAGRSSPIKKSKTKSKSPPGQTRKS